MVCLPSSAGIQRWCSYLLARLVNAPVMTSFKVFLSVPLPRSAHINHPPPTAYFLCTFDPTKTSTLLSGQSVISVVPAYLYTFPGARSARDALTWATCPHLITRIPLLLETGLLTPSFPGFTTYCTHLVVYSGTHCSLNKKKLPIVGNTTWHKKIKRN